LGDPNPLPLLRPILADPQGADLYPIPRGKCRREVPVLPRKILVDKENL
jgi:hypothetical protein